MNKQNNIGLVTPIAGAVSLISSSQNARVMSLADLSALEIHEAARLFPAMQEQEFAELKEDIRINGLQMPILTFGGIVVDGCNRLQACIELGIIPRFEEIQASNESIWQKVISINLHRRHLTEGQRALIGARLSNSSIPLERSARPRSLPIWASLWTPFHAARRCFNTASLSWWKRCPLVA